MKTLLISILLSLFIYGCSIEGNPFEGNATYELDGPCYDEWTLSYYKIDDEDKCNGEIKRVSLRTNEKTRLENVLANNSDTCVQVEIKYYWLGIKLFTDGYIENSTSTFFHSKRCK